MPSLVKKLIVRELAEKFGSVEDLVVVSYRGVSAKGMVEVRRDLRRAGAEMEVIKNRLAKLAFDQAGMAGTDLLLEGPSALVTGEGKDGVLGLAKAVGDLGKKVEAFKVMGGYSGGSLLSGAEVERLSKIPSLKALQAELVGGLVGPASGLVVALQQLAACLVYALEGIKEQKESSA